MSIQALIEKIEKEPLEDVLRRLYIERDMSMHQVAEELCVSVGLVHKWLHDFSITKNYYLWENDRYFTSD